MSRCSCIKGYVGPCHTPKHDANLNLARRYSNDPTIAVRTNICGGCGGVATVMVNGLHHRCQRCANKLVNIWNTMRNNKQGGDS